MKNLLIALCRRILCRLEGATPAVEAARENTAAEAIRPGIVEGIDSLLVRTKVNVYSQGDVFWSRWLEDGHSYGVHYSNPESVRHAIELLEDALGEARDNLVHLLC